MNPWLDFLITILVRFVCGAAIGAVLYFIVGFRFFIREVAQSHFPIERVLVFAVVGGLVCMLTTPRDSLPWVR